MSNMQKRQFPFLIFTALIFLVGLYACQKRPSAGFGGNATLKISAKHHGTSIDSGKVYIKFNAKDVAESYDAETTINQSAPNQGMAVFEGMKPGDYYIYSTGWDPSISANVKGGIPFTIEEEKTYEIVLPVTEQH
jgi:hypothetical protein